MSEFDGKIVLVTGCARARGMGRAISVAFARAGADIVLNGREPSPELDHMSRGLAHLGVRAITAPGDVTTPEGWDRLAAAVAGGPGRLDVLVCAAAAVVDPIPLRELDAGELAGSVGATLRALWGPFHRLLPLLTADASVVFVSSGWVVDPPAGFSHYVAAKLAGEAFMRAAAIEAPQLRSVVARPPRMLTDQTNPIADLRPLARPIEVATALVGRIGALDAGGYVELTL